MEEAEMEAKAKYTKLFIRILKGTIFKKPFG